MTGVVIGAAGALIGTAIVSFVKYRNEKNRKAEQLIQISANRNQTFNEWKKCGKLTMEFQSCQLDSAI